ncbi:GTP cyclohydrolase II RibA [Falsirhodobacter halotolerans]|uniref:GTP cyclohydrolase II RibA n=1 Tax=Falsirhodobacter halotolerans TaxID=1146892 RepID=UPI001FD55A18|nr:GTP cyclohydrolase II RibA [Falsirhodobacter halotolerans]MCJ8139990.1 GTP cyclohydrolase II RibA [Falsirhodobacter halotolerans]
MTVHDRQTRVSHAVNHGLFSGPAIHFERAVSELRYGRPVLLRDGATATAIMALDAASPDQFNRMADAAEGRHDLFLSGQRAVRMDVASSSGILLPLSGVGHDAAVRLAYRRGATLPGTWRPAPALMRAASDLTDSALLLPALVCAAPTAAFAGCAEISVEDLRRTASARTQFEIVARTPVPLRDLGMCDFVVFRGGLAQRDQVAIVVGTPDLSKPVPVRIHSSCITGDLAGSLKCDCGDQLQGGLAALKEAGGGVLIYLDQEGRGTGLRAKMRAYALQHDGLDTLDADAELGFHDDHRRYEAASAMLRAMGIASVDLHTNNPTKVAALQKDGIDVASRKGVPARITSENLNYLRTKSLRAGHIIDYLPVGG